MQCHHANAEAPVMSFRAVVRGHPGGHPHPLGHLERSEWLSSPLPLKLRVRDWSLWMGVADGSQGHGCFSWRATSVLPLKYAKDSSEHARWMAPFKFPSSGLVAITYTT